MRVTRSLPWYSTRIAKQWSRLPDRRGACLAARTPPATMLCCHHGPRPVLLTNSKLAEAAVELPPVVAVHVAITIEVEVPQVTSLAFLRPERGPEEVAVHSVHVVVPI